MLATLTRVRLRTRSWYRHRSQSTQLALDDAKDTLVQTLVIAAGVCLGILVLALVLHDCGFTEPLAPGEFEAIQQLHQHGQTAQYSPSI
jgi:hypothetical protein